MGTDINPLAHFVTVVKTTPLSSRDRNAILHWADGLDLENTNIPRSYVSDPRLKNVPDEARHFLASAASTLSQLEVPRQQRFARCVLVKVGQWAIDCRKAIPSTDDMNAQLLKQTVEMLNGLDELVQAAKSRGVAKNKITSSRMLYCGSLEKAMRSGGLARSTLRPRLVLTSPPYPGVHVLYHRWQVGGRRETPAPYWLADLRDGHGESFYTLGGRSRKGLETYFVELTNTFGSLHKLVDPDALVVQLVAFSDPDMQLPAFLHAMRSAGYEELTPFRRLGSKRPSREVPNRKWYTQIGESQCPSNETLLFHRPRS